MATERPNYGSASQPPTKVMYFYKNGESNYSRKRCIYNKAKFPTFDSFLNDLTKHLEMQRSVRSIRTPKDGKRIVTDYDDIEDGASYVATVGEPFKRLPNSLRYEDIESPNRRRAHKGNRINYDKRRDKYPDIKGKINDPPPRVIRIGCNANGDTLIRPSIIKVHEKDTLESIYEDIREKLGNRMAKPVKRLLTHDGRLIRYTNELKYGENYIACSDTDKFQEGSYHGVQNFKSPRSTYPILPAIGSNKSSPESSVNSHHSKRRRTRDTSRSEENGGIPNKPIKHQRSSEKRQVDYDADRGGVFKAKNKQSDAKDAREVRDSKHTRTDLPIDQVEAEEVKYQNLDDNDIELESNDNGESLTSADSYNNRNVNNSNKKNKDENTKDEKEVPSGIELSKLPSENITSQNDPAKQDDIVEELPSESRNLTPQYSFTEDEDYDKKTKDDDKKSKNTRNYYSDRHDHDAPQVTDADNSKDRRQGGQSIERNDYSKNIDKSNDRDRNQQTNRNTKDDTGRSRSPTPSRERDSKENKSNKSTTKTIQSQKNSTRPSSREKRDKAATTIQANYKGFKAREKLSTKTGSMKSDRNSKDNNKPSQSKEDLAATKIQAGYRGYSTRKSLKEKKGKKMDSNDKKEKAATTIQSHYRGHRTRKTTSTKKEDKKKKAATTIQKNYRGHMTRKKIEDQKKATTAY